MRSSDFRTNAASSATSKLRGIFHGRASTAGADPPHILRRAPRRASITFGATSPSNRSSASSDRRRRRVASTARDGEHRSRCRVPAGRPAAGRCVQSCGFVSRPLQLGGDLGQRDDGAQVARDGIARRAISVNWSSLTMLAYSAHPRLALDHAQRRLRNPTRSRRAWPRAPGRARGRPSPARACAGRPVPHRTPC